MMAWVVSLVVVVSGSVLPAIALWQLPAMAVPDNDKAAHFFAYVVLSCLPVVAVDLLRAGLKLACAMVPLGISLELIQRMVPGRSFEVADMGANTLGVMAGLLVGLAVRWLWRSAFSPGQETPPGSSRAFGR